jgi:ribosomal protein L34E
MPIEITQLEHRAERLTHCPKCGKPFEAFLRGQVQRWPRRWLIGPWRPHCALICRACKDIVGYEGIGDEFEIG